MTSGNPLSQSPRPHHAPSGGRAPVNNVMRHEYRVLDENEKHAMQLVKDQGLELWNTLDSMGSGINQTRELSLAKTKLEEAVMWAVKHITR